MQSREVSNKLEKGMMFLRHYKEVIPRSKFDNLTFHKFPSDEKKAFALFGEYIVLHEYTEDVDGVERLFQCVILKTELFLKTLDGKLTSFFADNTIDLWGVLEGDTYKLKAHNGNVFQYNIKREDFNAILYNVESGAYVWHPAEVEAFARGDISGELSTHVCDVNKSIIMTHCRNNDMVVIDCKSNTIKDCIFDVDSSSVYLIDTSELYHILLPLEVWHKVLYETVNRNSVVWAFGNNKIFWRDDSFVLSNTYFGEVTYPVKLEVLNALHEHVS